MKVLQGSFFPKLLDLILVGDDDIFLVMELEATDLRTLIQDGDEIEFTEEHLRSTAYNLLCAAKFMSSSNIVHRDLSSANVLMNDQC